MPPVFGACATSGYRPKAPLDLINFSYLYSAKIPLYLQSNKIQMMLYCWDYNIDKHWRPKTDAEWIWFLERKINYDDWAGLYAKDIIKYFQKLKLDPGKKLLLKAYFKYYGKKKN